MTPCISVSPESGRCSLLYTFCFSETYRTIKHRDPLSVTELSQTSLREVVHKYIRIKVLSAHAMGAVCARYGGIQYQMERSGQTHAPAALIPEKVPLIPIEQKAVWVAGPVWTFLRRDNVLVLSGIEPRSLDCSSRCLSLYRLGYPDSIYM